MDWSPQGNIADQQICRLDNMDRNVFAFLARIKRIKR
jgi:hypothetical protein